MCGLEHRKVVQTGDIKFRSNQYIDSFKALRLDELTKVVTRS